MLAPKPRPGIRNLTEKYQVLGFFLTNPVLRTFTAGPFVPAMLSLDAREPAVGSSGSFRFSSRDPLLVRLRELLRREMVRGRSLWLSFSLSR